jgi:putative acetyltransferase
VHGDEIKTDDPRAADVRALLGLHLAHMKSQSPPENVFALTVTGLLDTAVTLYSYRRDGQLLGIGALKDLGDRHGELKSMHTAHAARRNGVGRAMLTHLIDVARARGYRLLSLETGSMAGFAPARALYATAGFTESDAFADYAPSRYSTFMQLRLSANERCGDGTRATDLRALMESAEQRREHDQQHDERDQPE